MIADKESVAELRQHLAYPLETVRATKPGPIPMHHFGLFSFVPRFHLIRRGQTTDPAAAL
ncbi:hypothetical protein N9B57_03055 [Verrucomicrobia bacterium]|jgi:hypothetical protein|nr:hypothetical protein [Verrucomicrobiota bacterium]MDA7510296.1 hypothetical protein [Verrucomicrobiota bacterium]MDA7866894.1 hypothetical protein [Verrucomicrobiota bacterium]